MELGIGFVIVQDIKVPAKVQREISNRIGDCQCLTCETKGKTLRRGLCPRCYMQFRKRLFALSVRERASFEARMVEAGKLLTAQMIRAIKSKTFWNSAS